LFFLDLARRELSQFQMELQLFLCETQLLTQQDHTIQSGKKKKKQLCWKTLTWTLHLETNSSLTEQWEGQSLQCCQCIIPLSLSLPDGVGSALQWSAQTEAAQKHS
jgi:hypothetical protein